jgi:energy-coupling factor transporter ATP-binding protein EcfA2
MIISLRGTSGSGKSHLVRRVTGLYPRHIDKYEEGRRNPLYTIHGRNRDGRCLVTPGHYLIGNGGVDTLRDLEQAYRIIWWAARAGHDVLYEGKNMSDGTAQLEKLIAENITCRVVWINTPVEECIRSVRERGHKIAEASIRKTDAKVRRDYEKFTCHKIAGDREACFQEIKRWLGPHEEFLNGQPHAD